MRVRTWLVAAVGVFLSREGVAAMIQNVKKPFRRSAPVRRSNLLSRLWFLVLAGAICSFSLTSPALGADYHWDGPGYGNWMVASNWNPDYTGSGFDDGDTFVLEGLPSYSQGGDGERFSDTLILNPHGAVRSWDMGVGGGITVDDLHLNGGWLWASHTVRGNISVDATSYLVSYWHNERCNVYARLDGGAGHALVIGSTYGDSQIVVDCDAANYSGSWYVHSGKLSIPFSYRLGDGTGTLTVDAGASVDIYGSGQSTGIISGLTLIDSILGSQTFAPGIYDITGVHVSQQGNSVAFSSFFTSGGYHTLEVVPEPASLVLLAFGGVAALLRRRKR